MDNFRIVATATIIHPETGAVLLNVGDVITNDVLYGLIGEGVDNVPCVIDLSIDGKLD